jgi:putative oxidoreductase
MAARSFKGSVDLGLLVLRLVFGLYMAIGHGWGKLAGGAERWAEVGGVMGLLGITFLPALWGFIAAVAEFFGALLVAAGFATRVGAALLMGTMGMAAFMHIATGNGSPEKAIMYLVVFLVVFIAGPGKYSVDGRR